MALYWFHTLELSLLCFRSVFKRTRLKVNWIRFCASVSETMNLGKWRTPLYCSINRLSSYWFVQHFSSLRIENRRIISLATCIPNDTVCVACQGSPLVEECSQDFKKVILGWFLCHYCRRSFKRKENMQKRKARVVWPLLAFHLWLKCFFVIASK